MIPLCFEFQTAGTTKNKHPVQQGIDKQETNVVVHSRSWHSLCLKVESHALVETVSTKGVGSRRGTDEKGGESIREERENVIVFHKTTSVV